MIVGYRLVEAKTGRFLQEWGGKWGECPGIPNPLILPNGGQVCAPNINEQYDGYFLSAWDMDDSERPKKTVFDGADFLARVTDDEYTAITGSDNVQVRRWLDTFRLRGEIDVGGATAKAAKVGLVALGLLTQERADAVFAEE